MTNTTTTTSITQDTVKDSPTDTSMAADSNEKTIPFLRRLVDMLSENENVISFTPGAVGKKGQVTLGRVIVHDRIKVEKDVLPKYFNHSSFASLRRQLNYFNFVREGKGRQKGATYCNKEVIQLEDILRLRRRPIINHTSLTTSTVITSHPVSDSSADENGSENGGGSTTKQRSAIATKKRSRKEQDKVPPCSKSRKTTTPMEVTTDLASPPKIVSPRSTPSGSPATSPTSGTGRITLDLTLPPVETTTSGLTFARTSSFKEYQCNSEHPPLSMDQEFADDEDVLGVANILITMSTATA